MGASPHNTVLRKARVFLASKPLCMYLDSEIGRLRLMYSLDLEILRTMSLMSQYPRGEALQEYGFEFLHNIDITANYLITKKYCIGIYIVLKMYIAIQTFEQRDHTLIIIYFLDGSCLLCISIDYNDILSVAFKV